MLTILQLCLLLGCAATTIEPNTDVVEERPEQQEDVELLPDDEPWSYKPDRVLFHNVSIVTNENELSCFDDGDGFPYCGVYRIILAEWDNWEGIEDTDACHIIHRVAPEYVVENDVAADFLSYGAFYAWELDSEKSFVSTTTMCDFIAEESIHEAVLNKFKTDNIIFGYTMPPSDMMDEYRDILIDAYTDEEWTIEVAPYLAAMINRIDNQYRIPNFAVPFAIDVDNAPISTDGYYTPLPIDESETLVDGYYRARPFYVYNLLNFVPETEPTE